jgi:SAM-dependent methyltransferase
LSHNTWECELFKSIYFPADRTQQGRPVRKTVNLVCDGDDDFRAWLSNLSSRDIRLAMGDQTPEELESQATLDGRSLSNAFTRALRLYFDSIAQKHDDDHEQLSFALSREELSHGLTFRDSRNVAVHRWYPFVEGFSAGYVRTLLLSGGAPRNVFDPFGGSGTAQLEAARLGIPSFYCEINPFMAFVSETKVASAAWARANWDAFLSMAGAFRKGLTPESLARASDLDLEAIDRAFPARDFFEAPHLRDLLAARHLAVAIAPHPAARDLLLLACASVAVDCSNMTRRADLRRRRPDEYRGRVVDVAGAIRGQLDRMIEDIPQLPMRLAPMIKVSSDAKAVPSQYDGQFELAVTSPPYLNGTNYFRNTKIELWLLGFIESERELGQYRRRAVAAGINNVTMDREEPTQFDAVEAIARQLDNVAGDGRIPRLVRHYFSDMARVLAEVHRTLAPAGRFHLDIGDSKFYGVHVPTPDLLALVARQVGFDVDEPRVLARRHSRDKTPLTQLELILRKPTRARRPKQAIPPFAIQEFRPAHRELAPNRS